MWALRKTLLPDAGVEENTAACISAADGWQGSHTALPAFGYFMEKVLRDPQLAAKYRGKISDKPWPGLRVDDRPYNCQGYVAPSDTTDVDSTDVEDIDMPEEEIELDNNGNEIPSEPAQGNI